MITPEEWEKLKVGDMVWYTRKNTLKPKILTIKKITEKCVYCGNARIDKNDYLLHADLNSATQVVNFRLKMQIKKIQQQIVENSKQLEQENGN